MKKAVLALVMAIVMLSNFSITFAVMAHDTEKVTESMRVVCPFCYGTQTTQFCSRSPWYVEYSIEPCTVSTHSNFCWVVTYDDTRVTACRDCGYEYSRVGGHSHVNEHTGP